MRQQHPFVIELEKAFVAHRNQSNALKQKAYMKDIVDFLGLAKPLRVKLEKPIIKKYNISATHELHTILQQLWKMRYREFHYTACKLALYHKKLWNVATLAIFEEMLCTTSWWDTVDEVAVNLVGALLRQYPDLQTTMEQWIKDEFVWKRRAALIYQLRYKDKTDYVRLFAYCQQTMHEKDFFIRKAIGWSLREYSKIKPEIVREFVEQNREQLSGLSYREATRQLA